MSYTTDFLIASIKRKAATPTSQSLFSESDFLAMANEEMDINLVPEILSVREEYFSAEQDVTVVAGQTLYPLPDRAIGQKLRDVQLISGTSITSLPRLYEEDRESTTEQRSGFYLRNNSIILSPTPTNSSDVLRLVHYRRPNRLVPLSEVGRIISIDRLNNQIEVATIPTTFTTDTLVDFIKAKNGFDWLAIDQSIVGVSGSTVTFSSLPSDLVVGDFMCLAEESPVPQIPSDLHPLLAQMVAVKCLESMGDDKVKVASQILEQMRTGLFKLISPRVDGEPRVLVSRTSLLSFVRGR